MGKINFKSTVLGILCLMLTALPLLSQDDPNAKAEQLRTDALKMTVYLSSERFPQLPPEVREYLSANHYLIPQVGKGLEGRGTGNVIQGQFYEPGKTDWAVLASKDQVSRILVFREGKGKPDELAEFPDLDYMSYPRNDDQAEDLRFSREISAVEGETIAGYYKAFGGPQPPAVLDHQGIDNCFIDECVSRIWYFYNGEWNWYQGRD